MTGISVFVMLTCLSLVACAVGADKLMPAVGATMCEEPRSQACTRDYRPVCASLEDGSEKTYSNGCTACADAKVIVWVEGPCPE
jgi:hypothetical protein